jgi:hypothetical protein
MRAAKPRSNPSPTPVVSPADLLDVGAEPHVKQAVRLVQNQHLGAFVWINSFD